MAKESTTSAVDIGLASEGDRLKYVPPVAHERWHLVEDATAGKPVPGLAQVVSGGVVAILPDTMIIEDLHKDISADGKRNTRVEEVAGIDDNRGTTTLGL